jgi:predicted metal-binding membrane protein
MVLLVALGPMSLTGMAALTVLITAQKLLPAKPVLDVPVALAVVGLGVAILVAPASLPGLMPTM